MSPAVSQARAHRGRSGCWQGDQIDFIRSRVPLPVGFGIREGCALVTYRPGHALNAGGLYRVRTETGPEGVVPAAVAKLALVRFTPAPGCYRSCGVRPHTWNPASLLTAAQSVSVPTLQPGIVAEGPSVPSPS